MAKTTHCEMPAGVADVRHLRRGQSLQSSEDQLCIFEASLDVAARVMLAENTDL